MIDPYGRNSVLAKSMTGGYALGEVSYLKYYDAIQSATGIVEIMDLNKWHQNRRSDDEVTS